MRTSAGRVMAEAVTTMAAVLVLGLSAIPPALATTAMASATVIEGVNVTTSLGSLAVTVSRFGGWVTVATPSSQPRSLASNSSTPGGGSSSTAAASLTFDGSSLTSESVSQLATDGTVQGDTVSTLSLQRPAAGSAKGNSVNIMVAFN